jgi:hypothetical protein
MTTVLDEPAAAHTRVAAARRRIETDLSFDMRTRRLETIYDALAGARRTKPNAGSASLRVPHA